MPIPADFLGNEVLFVGWRAMSKSQRRMTLPISVPARWIPKPSVERRLPPISTDREIGR